MTLPDRGLAGEAAGPGLGPVTAGPNPGLETGLAPNGALDLAPDPGLSAADSNNELVILYHLQRAEELEVTGPDAQSAMRRELGIDHLSWQKLTADLGSRGVLRQARGHTTRLDLKHLLGAADRPFVTPRLLEAAEERQPGFTGEANQLRALRQVPAEAETTKTEPEPAPAAAVPGPPSRRPDRPIPAPKPARPATIPAAVKPSKPAKADTPAAYTEAERQRARNIVALYRKFSRIANVSLPADTVHRLIRPLDRWEYTTEGVNPPVHYLTRQALGSLVRLKLSEPPTPARSIHRDRESITIRVEGEPLRGRDLLTMLKIESQYPRNLVRQELEGGPKPVSKTTVAARALREAKDAYAEAGDVLTDSQTVVLSNMTRYKSHSQLCRGLETTSGRLNELLQPLRERIGVEYNPGNPDSYIQLTLVALALGIAEIDDLPKASERQVAGLEETDSELLAKYYSFDPAERESVREGRTETALSVMWSRLYRKIGINGHGRDSRYDAILYAVRNDIFKLPPAAAVEAMLRSGPPDQDRVPDSPDLS